MSIAVMAVIATFSIGGLMDLYRRHHTEVNTARLFHGMQYARALALIRQERIGICGTTDAQHCGTDWSQGFMIFKAPDKLKPQPIPSEHCLHHASWQPIAVIHSHRQSIFYFTERGFSLTRGTIDIETGSLRRKIIVFDSGRVRFGRHTTDQDNEHV